MFTSVFSSQVSVATKTIWPDLCEVWGEGGVPNIAYFAPNGCPRFGWHADMLAVAHGLPYYPSTSPLMTSFWLVIANGC